MSESEPPERSRARMLRSLRIYFANRRWPRLMMTNILLLTGLAGFGTSIGLLHLGLERMWLRYPLAAIAAWLCFVGLMRAWAELERRALPSESDPTVLLAGEDPGDERDEPKKTSLGEWLDPTYVDFSFDDEGCLAGIFVWVFVVLLCFCIGGVFTVLLSAPVLIAEVFLDAVLVTALYKRVKGLDRQWWVAGVVRRTWAPALITAVLLALVGFVMQALVPEAHSIGGVIRQWDDRPR